MISAILTWIFGGFLLWLMSLIPFMHIVFDRFMGHGRWLTILIVALVLGLINAIIAPIMKFLFKTQKALPLFIISLAVNIGALWLAGWLMDSFSIELFPTAVIAAAVLAFLNIGVNSKN